MEEQNKILIYSDNDGLTRIDVVLDGEIPSTRSTASAPSWTRSEPLSKIRAGGFAAKGYRPFGFFRKIGLFFFQKREKSREIPEKK